MSKKKRENFKKKHAGMIEPGDLIQMTDIQRDFLKVRNKYVHNPEMEALLAMDTRKRDKKDLQFGQTPLPWEEQMTKNDFVNLNKAKLRKFICKNPECASKDTEQIVNYSLVTCKKELPTDSNESEKFGRRVRVVNHIAVSCKSCNKRIKFVKYNLTNRRAAKDPLVSGPHQQTRR